MKPKTFYRIILAVIIVFGLALLALWLVANRQTRITGVDTDIRDLFPFDSSPVEQPDPVVTIPDEPAPVDIVDTTELGERRNALFQITDFPITAHTSQDTSEMFEEFVLETVEVTQEDGTVTEEQIDVPVERERSISWIRYNKKETGEIFETKIPHDQEELVEVRQLSDTRIPLAQEAAFADNDNSVYLRFFNENSGRVETFFGSLQLPDIPPMCTFQSDTTLAVGDRGESVRALQQLFNTFFQEDLVTDGVYGNGTRAVVERFQEANQIEVSGDIDQVTLDLIVFGCSEVSQAAEDAKEQPGSLLGNFLPTDISEIALHPNGDQLLYLAQSENGTVGYTSDLDGGNKKEVFDSPFSYWKPAWFGGSEILFTTKASGRVLGHVFKLNMITNTFSKVFGDLRGLTTSISPTLDHILYSEAGENNMKLHLLERENNTTRQLGISTLPEKCAWTESGLTAYCAVPVRVPVALYPDDWYMGRVEFRDQLWEVNIQTGQSDRVTVFDQGENRFDMTQLSLSDSETLLFFVDKSTGHLWGFELF